MFLKEVSKEYINTLPVVKYEGEVVIVASESRLFEVLEEIRLHKVVGIDTETRPCFRKGEYHPVSLVQLAVEDKVFLVRLKRREILEGLLPLFSDESILKVGISLRDDLAALRKIVNFNPAGFIDLNAIARDFSIKNEGVRNLTAIFLGFRISKSQQTSNWENEQLTESQIRYAATDAWVCYEIYKKILKLNLE